MRPNAIPSMADVLTRIEQARSLALQAENAFRIADPIAADFVAAADGFHCQLLKDVSALSETEADSIEPAFTAFESQLIRVHTLMGFQPLKQSKRKVS